MRIRNRYATFDTHEVERITGVGRQVQREWRRRGHFHRNDGSEGNSPAVYDTHDLARHLAMRLLGDRGVIPSISSDISQSAALRIEYFAYNLPASVEDATSGAFERALAKSGRPRGSLFVSWTNAEPPEQFLLVGADGVVSFANDVKRILSDASADGAVVLLDLKALGTIIATRAGRPLVTVELVKQ